MACQTFREGMRTWGFLTVITLVLPALIYLRSKHLNTSLIMLIGVCVSLVAGASIFGLENRVSTQRFLTHHGARPGLIWFVKLAAWCVGLAIIYEPLALIAGVIFVQTDVVADRSWLAALFTIPLFLSIALLCGMTIRRSITAVVVALMVGTDLLIPQVALVVSEMLPLQGLMVIPAGLILVSWIWSADWVGPDCHDDRGITFKDKGQRFQPLDIVFAIPPLAGAVDASKEKDRHQD
jgi:hypothetical protein